MINVEKMESEFGYTYESLSNGSSKDIYLKCDYCDSEIISKKKYRTKANKILDKDACNNCKYIKRKELSVLQYGVENSAQRTDVRNKISQNTAFRNKDKMKQAMFDKYGIEHPMNSQSFKNKQKQTIQNKYGVDNISQLKETRDKVKHTNLERYGVEEFLSSKSIREQIKQTNLDKYGVENVFQSEQIKNKITQKNIEKYGCYHPMQNDIIKSKVIKTTQDLYGVSNIAQSTDIQDKIKQTNIIKYGYPYATQNDSIKAKLRKTRVFNGKSILINNEYCKQIADKQGIPYSSFMYFIRTYGLETALKAKPKINTLESIIENILKKHNINYTKHKEINNRKTDFIVENSKLVLEIDGLYWHSDANIEDKSYHHKKQQAYSNLNYKSLFFRENEIREKLSILESMILNQCGLSNKIHARKCKIVELSCEQSNTFFNNNHLMGKGKGVCFGLSINNEIVSAIRIKQTKNNHYEISRFCNILYTTVIGGFSRLLKFSEQSLNLNNSNFTLTTFIDKRYGQGHYLIDLGFIKEKSYLSFAWTDGINTWHRMRFPKNSGYEKNLFKIWDCGQQKYVKTYSKVTK